MVSEIFQKIRSKLDLLNLKRNPFLILKGSIHLRKRPIIKLVSETRLELGDNVLLNSDNENYHINLFSPVKIIIDKKGGEIAIGKNTRIHGSCIHAQSSIQIGSNCLIAGNCQIMDFNGHQAVLNNPAERIKTIDKPKAVIIEDNVWLGTGVIVLPGVRIGEGSVITANSVVHKDVPPRTIYGGNPIQLIKSF